MGSELVAEFLNHSFQLVRVRGHLNYSPRERGNVSKWSPGAYRGARVPRSTYISPTPSLPEAATQSYSPSTLSSPLVHGLLVARRSSEP